MHFILDEFSYVMFPFFYSTYFYDFKYWEYHVFIIVLTHKKTSVSLVFHLYVISKKQKILSFNVIIFSFSIYGCFHVFILKIFLTFCRGLVGGQLFIDDSCMFETNHILILKDEVWLFTADSFYIPSFTWPQRTDHFNHCDCIYFISLYLPYTMVIHTN